MLGHECPEAVPPERGVVLTDLQMYLIVNKLLSHTHTESIRINKCSKRRYGERRKRDKDNTREVTWDFRMGFVFTTSAVGLFSADKTFIGANDLLSLH
jgi:hypothetical protein